MIAFIFPGQGSQHVGMGADLAAASPAARALFQEVDEALEQHLFRLMTSGEAAELMLTENAQPAIMANAIATLRVIEAEGGVDVAATAAAVAGHSLGEYAALCAAGAFDVATTARLLRVRGRAMQAAVPVGEGAMCALVGADLDQAGALAAAAVGDTGAVCTIANDNDPGQVVLSGHAEAIARAMEMARDHGIRRAVALSVSAPFHCPLMAPAAEVMADALAATSIADPAVPVYANTLAAPLRDAVMITGQLVEQVTGRVRWRESVIAMEAAGIDRFVELGGKLLSPMVKRSASEAVTATPVVTMDDIEALLKSL